MNEAQKWQLIIGVVALFFGGLAGAIFKALWDSRKERIQPIGRKIDVLPILKPTPGTGLETRVVVSRGTEQYQFSNLFVFDIEMINKGTIDIKEFTFSATLKDGDQAIYVEYETRGRLHKVTHTPVSPNDPKSDIDFTLDPFNRRTGYGIKIYVVVPNEKSEPSPLELDTAHPVKFTDILSMAEIVARSVEVSALQVGPFRFTIFRD